MSDYQQIKTIILNLILIILCAGCAKIVSPTGGPKDTTPPKIVKVTPENQSLNFSSNTIKIQFDEYVTLNNPSENVLISPPLSTIPEYSISGKTLTVKFKDTLRKNTTYNMLFSESIKDYHEGNALSFFHYSFSTGDSLDNFLIRGTILDAKTLAPKKGFSVMLYKNDADSLPRTTLPDYITKTHSDGSFTFQNITKGNYKLFAVNDINADMMYSLPNEEIAFSENLVEAVRAVPDSAADSVKASIPLTILYAFTDASGENKLLRHENPAAGIYKFPFKNSFNSLTIKQIAGKNVEFYKSVNDSQDTVTFFLKSTISDTSTFIFQTENSLDTVKISPFKAKAQTGRTRTKNDKKLSVKIINAGELGKTPQLSFSYPVRPKDSIKIFIYSKQKDIVDTTEHTISIPDTFVMQLPLLMPFTDKKSYKIMIPDSTFFGFNDQTNDTLIHDFIVKTAKDYGTLIMNYKLPDNGKTYIATLWNGEVKISEHTLTESQTINYNYLIPNTYRISVFCDENKNGKWDGGNYSEKRQAEKMFAFPQNIAIRAYWDSEETFEIIDY